MHGFLKPLAEGVTCHPAGPKMRGAWIEKSWTSFEASFTDAASLEDGGQPGGSASTKEGLPGKI